MWTQPICDECWRDRYPGRTPTRLREPEPERCAYCGRRTVSGIYVRDDPGRVPFPREERT